MRLASKVQLLEGGVVPESLRKHPGPFCLDAADCIQGPRAHTHTHSSISASQVAVIGRPGSASRQSPGRTQGLREPREQYCRIIGYVGAGWASLKRFSSLRVTFLLSASASTLAPAASIFMTARAQAVRAVSLVLSSCCSFFR